MKRYMRKSEIWTFGIGLFGVSLLTGWMPDYTYTFFNDFAFKGSGIDPASITKMLAYVFGFAGIVGARFASLSSAISLTEREPNGAKSALG